MMYHRRFSAFSILALLGFILVSPSIRANSGGWTMFAPTPELQSAFGEELKLSPESVIHASGKNVDYMEYGYVAARTKAKLFIAYATYSSVKVAERDFQRITTSAPWSRTLQVLNHPARYVPKGGEQARGANLMILIRNEMVMVRADNMLANEATCRKLEKVARVVLSPALRGHL
jgi:hypothetical protein